MEVSYEICKRCCIITASAMMLYSESVDDGKKKMIKKGKQFARKIGIS